ncbi:MAG: aminotransferase class V-fold PLP-dependent enzyme, partial [Myxococcota bacterium]
DALDAMVQQDVQKGLRPWVLVASAGSTDTGAVDPLPQLADIATNHGLWFHVDAAYGGAFALCDEGRRKLAGIERSDSVVFDPHKGLFLPWGTGVVLVKDRRAMVQAHAYQASYLNDFSDQLGGEDPSPADMSAELSRPFRGLRVWLTLQLVGVVAIRAALEEKLVLAQYFHQQLQAWPDFEVGPAPDLSVVTFRWVPKSGDADAANLRLVDAVQHDGRIYLSSTVLDGRVTLRLAILNARTHLLHIDRALHVLRTLSDALAKPAD